MLYPAVIPAVALAAGIAVGIFAGLPAAVSLALAVLCFCVALRAFIARRETLFVATVICGFAAAGAALGATPHAAARHAPLGELFDRHVPHGEYQLSAWIEGRLRADAAEGPSGVTLVVDVERVEIGGTRWIVRGGAIVGVEGTLASGRAADWRAGRRVRLPATLRRPSRYLDPGVPDSRRELEWRRTSLVGSAKSGALIEILERGGVMAESLSAARAEIRRAAELSIAPWSAQSAAVVVAILIGDRAGLGADEERRLQEAGTYHVIAISGGNIAILAGLCLAVLRFLRARGRLAALLTSLALVVYAAVVGGGSSVARATTMAVLYFTARAVDHRSRPGNIAAATAALLVCANPLVIVDAGFALTFGATLVLIAGMPLLGRPADMPVWLFGGIALLAASVCAEIALLPLGAYFFSRVTAAGLLLNFAAIPLMTVVQVAGMAAVALARVNQDAALWTGFLAHLGVRGLLDSAALVDAAPWLVRRVPPPSLLLIAAYYAVLIAAMAARGRARQGLAAAAFACGWWIVAAPAGRFGDPALLRVAFLDVGQGDAAIVRFPDGRTLGIDAGGLPGSTFDIGSRVIAPAYWALGIRRLDYLAVSHGDPDHVGGAASVFRDFRPMEVWEGVPVPPHAPSRELRLLADRAGAPWRRVRAGDEMSFGDARLIVHHPPPPDWERQRVRNDDSEVLEIVYGGVSLVFTGDIGRDVERAIASSFEPAPVRILKVPHHGSATSSSGEFLRALRPDVAVISAGRGNPFGHPVPAVLDRYRAIGAAIYRTDLDGAVIVETDGRTTRIRTFTNRRLTLRDH